MTMTFELGKYHKRSSHLFADLFETLLMVGFEQRDTIYLQNSESLLRNGDISPDEADEDAREITYSEDESQKQEIISNINEDCVRLLEYRQGAFGSAYPFVVGEGLLKLKENLTDSNKIYLLLLACSRLRSYDKSTRLKWAGYFTRLSKIALESLLPDIGIVKVFDANSEDRRSFYGTDLRDALQKLGSQIGSTFTHEEACKRESSSGDNGLDLVGVVDYDQDSASGYYVIFGQCGAQEKSWPTKVLESSPIRFSSFFMTHTDPVNTMFIPICYRRADGTWVKDSDSNGCVLNDRLRIMKLLDAHKSKSHSDIVQSEWFTDFWNDINLIRKSHEL